MQTADTPETPIADESRTGSSFAKKSPQLMETPENAEKTGTKGLAEIGFDEESARAWLDFFKMTLGKDVAGWSSRMTELLSIERKAIDFHLRTQEFEVHWEEALEEYLEAKSKGVPLKHLRTAYDKVLVMQKSHNALLRQFETHLESVGVKEETRRVAARNLRQVLSSYGGSLKVLSRRDVDHWFEKNSVGEPVREELDGVIDGFLEFIKKSTLGALPGSHHP